jgi:hypothetical protein
VGGTESEVGIFVWEVVEMLVSLNSPRVKKSIEISFGVLRDLDVPISVLIVVLYRNTCFFGEFWIKPL